MSITTHNQHCANLLRHLLKDYDKTIPTVLEIPSKNEPYDAEQDYIMQVRGWAGAGLGWAWASRLGLLVDLSSNFQRLSTPARS
jgi:hypothetical protein